MSIVFGTLEQGGAAANQILFSQVEKAMDSLKETSKEVVRFEKLVESLKKRYKNEDYMV